MCVLVTKPAGVPWVSEKELRNCFNGNKDGAGLCWHDGKELWLAKGYFKFESLYKQLKAVEEYPVMLHFRFATHGTVKRKNCHPFVLKNNACMAHNGVISGLPAIGDKTDSEAFCRAYLDKFTVKQLKSKAVGNLVEGYLGGSKVALLLPDGDFVWYNKHLGVTHEDLWFSNDGYKDRVVYNFADDYGDYWDYTSGTWKNSSTTPYWRKGTPEGKVNTPAVTETKTQTIAEAEGLGGVEEQGEVLTVEETGTETRHREEVYRWLKEHSASAFIDLFGGAFDGGLPETEELWELLWEAGQL
jgi:hypothetical protein